MAPGVTRALLVLAAVAAVTVGALLRPAPRTDPPMSPAEAAQVWAQRNGLTLRGSTDLMRAGLYGIHRFTTPNGCKLNAVPLGRADEILPTLHTLIDAEDWGESLLLLDRAGPMPESTLGIQARRLLARLRLGHAPQAVMLLEPPGCLPPDAVARLTEWPAP
jgi:hypothetical protein